ncbi:hypothetical protein N7532_004767 [Penicillium argentinense]|uniref:Uncharacterized protein n=1 Tax=Penicillium argentinense TaxID=1131581 RepID=A0A9W9FQ45_9EURO|nr:uncharacterized protein N7532_004767 [Penicillium argentinense]KAJ5104238.1 hypothetical protein N7532_004767 [Penicillium argentinense]
MNPPTALGVLRPNGDNQFKIIKDAEGRLRALPDLADRFITACGQLYDDHLAREICMSHRKDSVVFCQALAD